MVGRIIYAKEKGRSQLALEYMGPLAVASVTLYEPEGLAGWRLARRLKKIERILISAGAGRVMLGKGFPYRERLSGLRQVETLPFYRSIADVLALGSLDMQGVSREKGWVALSAPRLCPELRGAAERLFSQVRGLLIDVPEEGEEYARWLHGQYGLPVAPGAAGADVTVAFGPGGGRWGHVLTLYGEQAGLGGLEVTAEGAALPEVNREELLALLWEAGAIDRGRLSATKGKVFCPETLK